MPRPDQAPPSGWQWRADHGSSRPEGHESLIGGGSGLTTALAALALLGLVGGVGALIWFNRGDGEDATEAVADSQPDDGTQAAGPPAAEDGPEGAADPPDKPPAAAADFVRPTLDQVTWTTLSPASLEDLSKLWVIPRDTLDKLNPDLAAKGQLPTGTKVVVYVKAMGPGISIGPPNDGRLVQGVPLPESSAWRLPEDHSRAFAAADTLQSLLTGLSAEAEQYPGAEPIQIGELSQRRGGQIYGHQSHQTGIDVDIRLIRKADGDGFDPARNWFLVKTLIDGGDVRAIFLNVSEQSWLREAAKADVGEAAMADYFAYISHEPGHTIHMHVRFKCPEADKRCQGFAAGETTEADPRVNKLPPGFGKSTVKTKGTTKPGVLTPKAPPRTSVPSKPASTKPKPRTTKSKLPGRG